MNRYECEDNFLEDSRYTEFPQEEDCDTHEEHDRAIDEWERKQFDGPA